MSHRQSAYAAICLGLAAAWGLFLFIPSQRQATERRTAATAAQQRLTEVQSMVAQVPAILKADEIMSNRRSEENSKLYGREDVLHLFDHLKAEASNYHLGVEEITPPVEELLALNKSMAQSNQPQFINMTVRLSGGYIDFGRFVRSLEEADYFRGVNSCLVTGSPDGKEPLQLAIGFRALLGALRETT